jgi:hypothetical protein
MIRQRRARTGRAASNLANKHGRGRPEGSRNKAPSACTMQVTALLEQLPGVLQV